MPESAPQSALHNPTGEKGPHAQAWRAHTRGSVPESPATVVDLTERSRERIMERLGKPIEEPPPDPDQGEWKDPRTGRELLADSTRYLHFVSDPVPSFRAVRADYLDGLGNAREDGPLSVAAYRVFGLSGQACGLLLRFLIVHTDRAGRFAGLLVVALIVWVALCVADLNPLPFP
jgi:hypothetical protein